MKLCDRCRVHSCDLNYLGAACNSARKRECPDVQPNRAEIISNMSIDEMSYNLLPMLVEVCEDGIPSPEYIRTWLEESPQ